MPQSEKPGTGNHHVGGAASHPPDVAATGHPPAVDATGHPPDRDDDDSSQIAGEPARERRP